MHDHPQPHRHPPDDPREWLRRAREDLTLAEASIAGVGYEPRAFHAQQAAEKAIKAVCIARGLVFPYTHDLGRLLAVLATHHIDTSAVEAAARLNRFAIDTRYPVFEHVDQEEFEQALALARSTLDWANQLAAVSDHRVRETLRPACQPGPPTPDPAILAQLVDRIVAAVAPERIILFGSAARGTMTPQSDLDLLVVVARRDAGDDLHTAVYDAIRPLPVEADVVIATTQDLERYGHSIALVYRPALEEGRELYRRLPHPDARAPAGK